MHTKQGEEAQIKRSFGAKTFEAEKLDFLERSLAPEGSEDYPLHQKLDSMVFHLYLMLEAASLEVLTDMDIALACVTLDGRLLERFHASLRANKQVVLVAVSKTGEVLEAVSNELRADKEVVLAAVSEDPHALEFASEELRADREVVLAAAKQDYTVLEHASEELRGDREFFAALISPLGLANVLVRFASAELRNDKDFVLFLARKQSKLHYSACYREAGPHLKQNLSEESFCLAAESGLAIPGQPESAPILTVTLTTTSTESRRDSFHAEAVLGLSGAEFVCDFLFETRADRPPTLSDLAKKLVEESHRSMEVDGWHQNVFITFLKHNCDEPVVVGVWDHDRPLSDFLSYSL